MAQPGWQGAGEFVEISGDLKKSPTHTGIHSWMVLTAFGVEPSTWTPESIPTLDTDNLLQVQGPLCFFCERFYSEELDRRRCEGRPDD